MKKRKKRKGYLALVLSIAVLFGLYLLIFRSSVSEIYAKSSELARISDIAGPSAPDPASPLGGYNVLIADEGNSRLIEVTPEKKTVWEYDFHFPKEDVGADDAFFIDGGKNISVNLESYNLLETINYADKKVVWSYGVPGRAGHTAGYLNTPDDAYKLPNGDTIVADIKNCRVIEISPAKEIVRQYGHTKVCGTRDGYLDSPNGDTPLPNGHILISNIQSKNVIELDQNWEKVFSMPLPVKYPSDPQMTKAGNILVADYSNPGKIVEVSKSGKVVWEYTGEGNTRLDRPSLAIELPNGNILANDDYNDRVIVIDKKTDKIIWQYGTTKKPGNGENQLNGPDGVDIIMRGPSAVQAPAVLTPPTPAAAPLSIGAVSRHPQDFSGKEVAVSGYVLAKEGTYDILSDEKGGTIGYYDLPVSGPGVQTIQPKVKYVFTGILKKGRLGSLTKNPYHLELSAPISVP